MNIAKGKNSRRRNNTVRIGKGDEAVIEQEKEWTYGQHLQEIWTLKFLLTRFKKMIDENQDDPKLQKRITKLSGKMRKDLDRINKKTSEILKSAELMSRDLESLK